MTNQFLASFEDLSPELQSLIEDVRLVLSDINDEAQWFEAGNDMYAVLTRQALNEINGVQPFTSFTMESVPSSLMPLLHLGLTVKAISARMNQWVETPQLQGFSGPYADETQFLQRWQTRLQDLEPRYEKFRATAKLQFLPHGVGTVGGFWSQSGHMYSPIPRILHGMPTWYGFGR